MGRTIILGAFNLQALLFICFFTAAPSLPSSPSALLSPFHPYPLTVSLPPQSALLHRIASGGVSFLLSLSL